MIPIFKVKKAGIYASIQDKGRIGYQQFGVPVSGAMDQYAYKYGKYILHNPVNSPALEVFYGGLELEILSDHRIAITGANLEAMIDGKPVPLWKSFKIYKGQHLRFIRPINGSIAYLHVESGFYSEVILGSASVYPRGSLGSTLKKEIILYANKEKSTVYERGLVKKEIPTYSNHYHVKVWPSPHLDLFKPDSIDIFSASTYTLKCGDRMGYILNGPPLSFVQGSDILSEATQVGTIQVPNSGQPIILMADSQTIGGYATIGKVRQDDLWKVAQLPIGGKVQFTFLDGL